MANKQASDLDGTQVRQLRPAALGRSLWCKVQDISWRIRIQGDWRKFSKCGKLSDTHFGPLRVMAFCVVMSTKSGDVARDVDRA